MFRPANFVTRNALAAAGRALPRRRSRRIVNSISSVNKAMCSCFLPARSSACWRRTGLRAFAWPHLLFPTARCTSAPRRTCWRSGRGSEFAGIDYHEDEDRGIFWSNDPRITIGEMVRAIGVLELEEEMTRVRAFYRKARVRR